MGSENAPQGPDLAHGVADADLADGAMVLGHVGEEAVLLARRGKEIFALGATCTHYGGPLAEGVMEGETVRCPWHHACFALRTGEALAAPALSPVKCFEVRREGGRILVGAEKAGPSKSRRSTLERVVIVGGGAAGFAAAEMLRRSGFEGSLCMVSDDADPPCDRPNLSKDYLAGTAPEEWIPLREPAFYEENAIALRLGLGATSLDVESRRLTLATGEILPYDKLLLATGAEPIRLAVPGSDLRHVRTLRSLSDCRALIERARPGAKALVVGASFIGLEVAASLLKRGLEVHVAAPEEVPMERVLGPRLGRFIARLHEEHGVHFHLGRTVSEIEEGRARLDDRSFVEADLVVVGIGVRPRLELAQSAGLALDRGVLVDGALRTSAADVFAAGDIARWPDAGSKAAIRVEHWVVAERQGQTAAFNMLGEERRHSAPPFFWSQHYDLSINYVGHAEGWDGLEESGDPEAHDYGCRFRSGGRIAAYASLFRDEESLRVEIEMERSGRAKGGGPS